MFYDSSILRFGFLKLSLLLFLDVFSSKTCLAQPYPIQELMIGENHEKWYDDNADWSNDLVIGDLMMPRRASIKTHANYKFGNWHSGRLIYRTQTYDSVIMVYNIEHDILFIRHPTKFDLFEQPIRINQNQVEKFEIEGDLFSRSSYEGINGFVHQHYQGDSLKLLAKYQKRQSSNGSGQYIIYNLKTKRYIIRDGSIQKVKSVKTLINMFPNHKREIHTFIKSNDLKLDVENPNGWVKLVSFCDGLMQTR